MESFTDWLGQEVRVGDTVLYCQVSGRSANMGMAVVVKISTKWRATHGVPSYRHAGPIGPDEEYISSVSVRKTDGARWQPNTYAGSHYEDARKPGKRIDPWAKSGIHMANKDERGLRCIKTGALVVQGRADDGCRWEGDSYLSRSYWQNHSSKQTKYVETKFKDYVISVPNDEVKPVVLTVIDNITKWTGEVPGAEAA